MNKFVFVSLFLSLYSLSSLALLPSSSDVVTEKMKKATIYFEIWKRPIRKDNGRRMFAVPDKLVSRGVGVSLGDGYILTAYHVMSRIVENKPHHFVRVYTSSKERVKNLSVSRCEKLKGDKSPDLCLLKGDFKNVESIELPKGLPIEPDKKSTFALINQNREIGEVGSLKTGNFVKVVKIESDGEFKVNTGFDLYRMSIETAKSNSGSVVFNLKTGEVLGMTTNGIRLKQDMGDGTIRRWMEAEVIPSYIIRKYLNTPGWKTKPLPQHQAGYFK